MSSFNFSGIPTAGPFLNWTTVPDLELEVTGSESPEDVCAKIEEASRCKKELVYARAREEVRKKWEAKECMQAEVQRVTAIEEEWHVAEAKRRWDEEEQRVAEAKRRWDEEEQVRWV